MPLYEYSCKSCKARLELFRTVSDRDALAWCVSCGKDVERVLYAAPPHVFIPGTGNSNDLAKHQRWYESPDTQAKLKSGELVHVKKPRTPLAWDDV